MQKLEFSPIVFIGGKGGVGKTTISASIASKFAKQGKKTLIISTDPAHSLGDVFKIKLSSKPKKINHFLDAIELNPDEVTNEHFKNIQNTLEAYSKPEMYRKIKEHLELSKQSPGASEAAMLESICKFITEKNEYEHIIFDTAPTGHTIRLLVLPKLMSAWTDGLLKHQQNQEKLKNAAEVFWQKKPEYKFNPFKPSKLDRWKRATKAIQERKELFERANLVLKDQKFCKVFLVLIPQMLPLEETQRTTRDLESCGIDCSGIFINQIIPKNQKEAFWQIQVNKQNQILEKIQTSLSKFPKLYSYLSQEDIRGFDELSKFEFLENL